jgi:hypothetical protein
MDIYFYNNIFNQSIIHFIDIIILNLGIFFIIIESNIRNIIGLIIIVISINIYIISKGYILIPLLLIISLVSISIIIFILKYNITTIYKNNNNNIISILIILYSLFIMYCKSSYINSYNNNNVNNIELLSYILIFESNILINLLIFMMFMFILIIIKFSNKIIISYNIYYFNIFNYIMMNSFILLFVAILICYIPIIIRYKYNIFKWSNDIYEVGIGVNMSNSLYFSLSNYNLGNYFIYFYIYLFIFLDIIINIIIIFYFMVTNYFIYFYILFFIIIYISYSLLYI